MSARCLETQLPSVSSEVLAPYSLARSVTVAWVPFVSGTALITATM